MHEMGTLQRWLLYMIGATILTCSPSLLVTGAEDTAGTARCTSPHWRSG